MLGAVEHRQNRGIESLFASINKWKTKAFISILLPGCIALTAAGLINLDEGFFSLLYNDLQVIAQNLGNRILNKPQLPLSQEYSEQLLSFVKTWGLLQLPGSLLCWLGLSAIDKRFGQDKFLRGSQVFTVEQVNKQIEKYLLDWIFRPDYLTFFKPSPMEAIELGYAKSKDKRDLLLGNHLEIGNEQEHIFIPEEFLYLMFAVSGTIGSGKSQLLEQVIPQAIDMHAGGLIIDYNGFMYSKFGRPQDRILSLYDTRKVNWDLWSEKVMPEDLAEILIPQAPDDKFFAPAAQKIFSTLLKQYSTLDQVYHALNNASFEELKEMVKGTEGERYFEAKNQGAGIASTMSTQLSAMKDIALWTKGKTPFSIVESAKRGSEFTYLIVHEEDKTRMMPWVRLWVDLYVKGILMREKDPSELPLTFMIIDEAPILGDLKNLKTALNNGRKYKLSCWLAWQDEGQMEANVGQRIRDYQACVRTRIFFNPNDSAGAKKVSEEIGEQEIVEVSASEMLSGAKMSQENLSQSKTTRVVISKEQLKNLDKLECIVKLPLTSPCVLKLSPSNVKSKNKRNSNKYPDGVFLGGSST